MSGSLTGFSPVIVLTVATASIGRPIGAHRVGVAPSFGIGHTHAVDYLALLGELAPDLARHVAVDPKIGEEAVQLGIVAMVA